MAYASPRFQFAADARWAGETAVEAIVPDGWMAPAWPSHPELAEDLARYRSDMPWCELGYELDLEKNGVSVSLEELYQDTALGLV